MEFNLMQDPDAARVIFDSGVPFVQIPCLGVASHLLTTRSELDETIKGRNAISDFLYERFVSLQQRSLCLGQRDLGHLRDRLTAG